MTHISPLFDPTVWTGVAGFNLKDITYHRHKSDGTVHRFQSSRGAECLSPTNR